MKSEKIRLTVSLSKKGGEEWELEGRKKRRGGREAKGERRIIDLSRQK